MSMVFVEKPNANKGLIEFIVISGPTMIFQPDDIPFGNIQTQPTFIDCTIAFRTAVVPLLSSFRL